MAAPLSEAAWLRSQLIEARGLLAQAQGVLRATENVAPDLFGLPVVQETLRLMDEQRKRPICVLPAHVKPSEG